MPLIICSASLRGTWRKLRENIANFQVQWTSSYDQFLD
jgi:hypothetical protein